MPKTSATFVKLQSYDVFIYKSTGPQSGNRYNSWANLMTAITKQEGAKTIQFEQDETIPAGAWNLDYVTLRGNGNEYNAGGYTVTFGSSTTISSWLVPGFNSLLLKSTSTTGHICTFTTTFSLLCETTTNVQSSATFEFFSSSASGNNIIALRNSARWSLIGTSIALFKFTGAAMAQTVILSRGDGAVAQNNTLSSTNAQVRLDIIGSVNQNLANYPSTHTGFTTGYFLPLTLTNISAAGYYVITITSASSPYTVVSEAGYLRCDATAGAITANLPASLGLGRLLVVRKTDTSANAVTIDGSGAETIDGAATLVLSRPNDTVTLIDATAGTWELASNYRTLTPVILFDHYADVGNVLLGEDDLYSDTLAASQLSADGQKLKAHYAGIFVSSATATRRLKAYFGGTLIYDSTALSLSVSADWDMTVEVIRESSTVVRCSVKVNTTTASSAPYTTYTRITALTLTNTQILKITGEAAGVGAATNDIVAKFSDVSWIPKA